MRLHEFVDNLDNGKPAGRDWFIGYELDDGEKPIEQVSTVLYAYSDDDALQEFHDNFWRIAYGEPNNVGPPEVDPSRLYRIIELRPATIRDRR